MNIPAKTLKNKQHMPQLGLGTWQLKDEECTRQVQEAIAMGYTHIDTAQMYGNEEAIGKAIADQDRQQLFITSKVSPNNLSYEGIIESCAESLEKLGTDYLDLYLIHWPQKEKHTKQTLAAFKKLHDEGKIRAFGVSNFTINHLKDIKPIMEELGLPVSVNQVEYHPRLNQQSLLDYCNDEDIIVTAYSPIARGELDTDELAKISEKHGKSEVQIALRWLTQKGLVTIPKSSSKEHAKANMDIFDFELDDEEMQKIDELGTDQRLINPPSMADFNY